jgi:hypothetical protein
MCLRVRVLILNHCHIICLCCVVRHTASMAMKRVCVDFVWPQQQLPDSQATPVTCRWLASGIIMQHSPAAVGRV